MRLSTLTTLSVFLAGAPLASAQWTTFHGNAQRNGQGPAPGPIAEDVAWTAAIGGPILSSPVLAPDGTIYLGSVLEDDLHPRHGIVAVNPDGSIRWRFATGFRDDQVLSTPALGPDGTLYVGSQDGFFYALNPDGTLKWKHASQSMIHQHPVVAPDGTVYVGIDGRLTAFDPSGAVLWQTAEDDMTFPGGPSLATDGTIYIGGGTYGVDVKLYAFAPNGTRNWTFTFPNDFYFIFAPPAVGDDGTIFTYTTSLYAIRPNGTQKWKADLSFGNTHYGSPAVDPQGNVYYAGDGAIWKLNANGAVTWSFPLQKNGWIGQSWSSPLVDPQGRVYVGLGTGARYDQPFERDLLVLNANGTERFRAKLGTIASTCAPAMGPDGTIYIGNLNGKLRAFRP